MSAGRSTTTRDRDRAAIRRTKPPCGICEQEIDYDLKSPDPMSFEVDHIIPLAKGGLDELANKQAAHRRPILQPHQVAPPRQGQRATHVHHQSILVVNQEDDPALR